MEEGGGREGEREGGGGGARKKVQVIGVKYPYGSILLLGFLH